MKTIALVIWLLAAMPAANGGIIGTVLTESSISQMAGGEDRHNCLFTGPAPLTCTSPGALARLDIITGGIAALAAAEHPGLGGVFSSTRAEVDGSLEDEITLHGPDGTGEVFIGIVAWANGSGVHFGSSASAGITGYGGVDARAIGQRSELRVAIPYAAGLSVGFAAYVFAGSIYQDAGPTLSPGFPSAYISSIEVLDEFSRHIPGISLHSLVGIEYPLHSRNAAMVPEPATFALVLAALLALSCRRFSSGRRGSVRLQHRTGSEGHAALSRRPSGRLCVRHLPA